jgi:hypothetical protein
MDAGTGGAHRHMFSSSEARIADDAGTPVRAGWVYRVDATHVDVG